MKSMLILTDFSESAFRAAEYSCKLMGSLQIEQILLYHAYQNIVAGTDMPAYVPPDDQRIYLESMEALALLQDRLKPMVADTIKIDLLAEDISMSGLSARINSLCLERDVELIVMGVSGKSGLEKLAMGSTTTEILKSSRFPVLIVPHDALVGREIKTIVFTTDLKEISATPIDKLNSFLGAFKADVFVVNVRPEAAEKYTPEMKNSIEGLHNLFDGYQTSFHYINEDNIVEGVLAFAKQHKASLIITIPKKHHFFSAIFHKSISKKLAYNSQIPLLSLPGLE